MRLVQGIVMFNQEFTQSSQIPSFLTVWSDEEWTISYLNYTARIQIILEIQSAS